MWPQRQLKLIETTLAGEKYGFAERFISFILLNEKKNSLQHINYLTVNKSLK